MKTKVIWLNIFGIASLILLYILVCMYNNDDRNTDFTSAIVQKKIDSVRGKYTSSPVSRKIAFSNSYDSSYNTIGNKKIYSFSSFRDTAFVTAIGTTNYFLGDKSFSDINLSSDALGLDSNYFAGKMSLIACKLAPINKGQKYVILQSKFSRSATFNFYNLSASLDFYRDWFDKDIYFYTKDSIKTLTFSSCVFKDTLAFKTLEGNERSGQDLMRKEGYQTPQQINGGLVFQNCIFNGMLDLSDVVFATKSELKVFNTNLPTSINLSGVVAEKMNLSNFTDSTGRVCNLILTAGTAIGNLNFEYDHFRIVTPGANKDEVTSIYQHVLRAMDTNGYKESYMQVDTEYRHRLVIADATDRKKKLSRDTSKNVFKPFVHFFTYPYKYRTEVFLDRLQSLWWDYGYTKWKVLLWSGLLLLLFSFYNCLIFDELHEIYYVKRLDPKRITDITSSFLKKVSYWWFCLVYTILIFFSVSFEFKKMNFLKPLIVTFIFQWVIGLICTGFIINLIVAK